METRPITLIVDCYTSQRDSNGNCYTLACFTSVALGQHHAVWVQVASPSNARSLGFHAVGCDWERLHVTEQTIGKRDWQRLRKFHEKGLIYEGASDLAPILARLVHGQTSASPTL